VNEPVVPAPITDAEAINVAKQALLEPGTDIDVNQIDVAVRAAGGLVWRRDDAGRVEIAMIHRPSYDDWTFPKGKRDPGETTKECALREVLEETGLVCELGIELTRTAYIDRKGRPKSVRYWTMTVVDSVPFEPGEEVDEVVWVPVPEIASLLTYDRDLAVLDSFHALMDD
jgi:8-oxo-dGTP diphosphatase